MYIACRRFCTEWLRTWLFLPREKWNRGRSMSVTELEPSLVWHESDCWSGWGQQGPITSPQVTSTWDVGGSPFLTTTDELTVEAVGLKVFLQTAYRADLSECPCRNPGWKVHSKPELWSLMWQRVIISCWSTKESPATRNSSIGFLPERIWRSLWKESCTREQRTETYPVRSECITKGVQTGTSGRPRTMLRAFGKCGHSEVHFASQKSRTWPPDLGLERRSR